MVQSASHGGIVLSAARNAMVPAPVRSKDGCYEEDCEWALAWVSLRKARVITPDSVDRRVDVGDMDRRARQMVLEWFPDHAGSLIGEAPSADNRILQERADYADARRNNWVVSVAAVGASVSNAVPEGMVGALLAPVHPQRDAPDRAREFFAMMPAALYRDSRLKSGIYIFDETEFTRIDFDPFFEVDREVITPEEAYGIASSWGSLIRDGDPGAVFYSFPPGDARPQDPAHRCALVAYTRSCLDVATRRLDAFEAATQGARADWPWGDPQQDIEDLKKLEAFFLLTEEAPSRDMESLEP